MDLTKKVISSMTLKAREEVDFFVDSYEDYKKFAEKEGSEPEMTKEEFNNFAELQALSGRIAALELNMFIEKIKGFM